jgi:hypothetical protein
VSFTSRALCKARLFGEYACFFYQSVESSIRCCGVIGGNMRPYGFKITLSQRCLKDPGHI